MMDGTATNPLLDEINGLSPGAKAALMQAHSATSLPAQAAASAPGAAGPQPAAPPRMEAPTQTPQIPMMGGPTAVVGPKGQMISPENKPLPPQGTVQGDQLERERLMSSGSGISQIQRPALRNLAKVGDTIGSIVAPGLTARIPGTEEHHNVLLGQNMANLKADTSTGLQQAQTQEAQGRVPLEAAQTAEAEERTREMPGEAAQKGELTDAQITNLLHPQAKTAFEDWRKTNPDAPTSDFFKAQNDAKPQKEDTPQAQTFDSLIAGGMTPAQAYEKIRERPPVIGGAAGQNEADKMGARLAKPYEIAATQAQAKLDRIDQTSRSVDAGYVGQGLSIPELLTSLVSGPGTGVRITQPELNAITSHRGIKGDAESWFNSLAGKGNLTGTDKAQIKAVLNDAKGRVLEKIQLMNDAQDAINSAGSREQVVEADRKYRAIQTGMEKFMEVRRDEQGNYYGSNDGGKTTYDLATGKEAK